jgi:flavin reductase (DIM6/NTAB) family NADH-FMN oxidoreductase RutF
MFRQRSVPDQGLQRHRPQSPGGAVDAGPEVFRDFMGAFPKGVSVVTTYDHNGAPRGFTCSSLCSVTLSPPTLLVCVDNRSGTLDAVRAGLRFAVNLLHSKAEPAARAFASGHEGRFQQVRWQSSRPGGLPHLHEDAHAIAECRLVGTHAVGTHTVLFGQIDAVLVSDRSTDGALAESPLLYYRRQFTECPAQ